MKYYLLSVCILLAFSLFSADFESDAVLLKYHTTVEVKSHKKITKNHVKLIINNRRGQKLSVIQIPYQKGNKVRIKSAELKDIKGHVLKEFSSGDFHNESNISDFSFYQDEYLKVCPVIHHIYPYILEYEYEITVNQYVYLDWWSPVIRYDIPTLDAQLSIEMADDFEMHAKSGFIEDSVYTCYSGKKRITWNAAYLPVYEEYYSPHTSLYLPYVMAVPDDFEYAKKGSFRSWSDFGLWQTDVNKDLDELTVAEMEKIDDLTDGITNDVDKIEVLYKNLLQRKRYVNISIETGGLQPHSAEYVCNNGYGDCKALSNYFKAVLAYIGVESFYTKVWAGRPIRYVDTTFVSQQSNHIILFVPLKKDTIWLDCTSKGPFNYLGTFTQNRLAFVVDGETSRFVRTPVLEPEDVLIRRKIEVSAQHSLMIADFTNYYKGSMYETLDQMSNGLNQKDVDEIIYDNIADEGFLVDDYSIFSNDSEKKEIGLTYSASSKKAIIRSNKELLLKQFLIDVPEMEKPEDRKLPVQLDYPRYRIDSVIYAIPDHYSNKTENDDYSIENEFGEYRFKQINRENEVLIVKRYLLKAGFYPLEKYDQFYMFLNAIHEFEKQQFLVFENNLMN